MEHLYTVSGNAERCSHYGEQYGGTSLAVQWLRLHVSTAGGTGLIPGLGTKILHAAWCGQKIKFKAIIIHPFKKKKGKQYGDVSKN